VRGTVFTVHVNAGRSVVRVYEGSVWAGRRVLLAGDSWASDQKVPALEASSERALRTDIHTALAARDPVEQAERARPLTEALPATVEPSTQPLASPAAAKVASSAILPPAPSKRPASAASTLDRHQLRELLRRGETEQVITLARARADQGDAFVLLLADALRAQGRFAEALDTYETLAERTSGATRTQAGFAAAQLALLAQRDAARALRDIERFELDGEGSALSERASVLHADALLALGRGEEARKIAASYLARQPATEASQRMRHILEDASVPP
jgi:tetratricopeptide (TPR) repeat protein